MPLPKRRDWRFTALPAPTPVTPADFDDATRDWRLRAPAEFKNILRAVPVQNGNS